MARTPIQRATLQDIAKEAGVSLATVSRVANNHQGVAEGTRTAVLKAMRRLRYVGAAKVQLRIGVIIPDWSNPFFCQLSSELEAQFDKLNAQTIIASSGEHSEREVELIERFYAIDVQGVVYIGMTQSTALLTLIADGKVPVVSVDRHGPADTPAIDYVSVDSRDGTARAISCLHTLGHRRIGYIRGLSGTTTAEERYFSFLAGMQRLDCAVDDSLVFEGNYEFESGRMCGDKILKLARDEWPTAILAANDLMALGLMQRLQEARIRIPDDLSVVGFDNIPESTQIFPRLTTLAQPLREIVETAVRLLRARMDERAKGVKDARTGVTMRIEPQLICRESIAKPRNKPALGGGKDAATP